MLHRRTRFAYNFISIITNYYQLVSIFHSIEGGVGENMEIYWNFWIFAVHVQLQRAIVYYWHKNKWTIWNMSPGQ